MIGVNLAIGPSCFVRCRGCYNFFGKTDRRGGLVSAAEVLDFVTAAQSLGVHRATLSGGDPLTHPEILTIIRGISCLGLDVKVDTVGTALLGDSRKIFYGRGDAPKVAVKDFARYVSVVGLPLDGSRASTIGEFRIGRPNLMDEVRKSAALLKEAGVRVCINTVVNRLNISDIGGIRKLVTAMGVEQWQLFEFQPIGPLGSRNAGELELRIGEFDDLVNTINSTCEPTNLRIECKSRHNRESLYFMVDDAGIAWLPHPRGELRTIVGHIVRERDLVLSRLTDHVRRASSSLLI